MPIFDNYKEASRFAAAHSVKYKVLTNLEHRGNVWVVDSPAFQRHIKEEAQESEDVRGKHLDTRRKYYESLTEEGLDAVWENREIMIIEEEELNVMRTVLRQKKGISPVPAPNIKVCPQCKMVGDNCTCGRTWY